MKTHIYHTVNCGLYFRNGSTGIFVDGIHKGAAYGYSDTTTDVIDRCLNGEEPFLYLNALIYTHCHLDHFSAKDAELITSRRNVKIYAPEYDKTSVNEKIISNTLSYFEAGNFHIYAIKTLHDGDENLRRKPHVSFVINTMEETFIIAGDAVFREGEAEKINTFCDHDPDIIFANPYQTMMSVNRSFLKKTAAKELVLVHKPYEKDDKYGIYRIFESAVSKYSEDLPKLIQPQFDSWIC